MEKINFIFSDKDKHWRKGKGDNMFPSNQLCPLNISSSGQTYGHAWALSIFYLKNCNITLHMERLKIWLIFNLLWKSCCHQHYPYNNNMLMWANEWFSKHSKCPMREEHVFKTETQDWEITNQSAVMRKCHFRNIPKQNDTTGARKRMSTQSMREENSLQRCQV